MLKNTFFKTFSMFSVTIICDNKIDLIVSRYFLLTSSIVKVFDFLTFHNVPITLEWGLGSMTGVQSQLVIGRGHIRLPKFFGGF